jgi:cell wall-associated NlpC family hydrolase
VLALVAPSTIVAIASPAAGDAISDKRAEAARIAKQLEDQSRQLAILAEDYDEAQYKLSTLEEQMATAKAKIAKTDEQASAIRRRLKDQAVASYVRGGSTQALGLIADARSTDEIAVRRQYVQTVTAGAGDVLDELRAVRLTLDEQRSSLADAQKEAKQATALAASKRKDAAAAQAAQKATLAKVQGELTDLVAAEAKRRAEDEARRVQAELAAKAAREAAARDAAAARNRAATTTVKPTSGTTTKPTATAPTSPAPSGGGTPAAGADAAVAEAKRQIGKPYQYGASGPDSFDCSGLTSWAWRAGGKSLPHSSRAQWDATSRVPVSDVQPGDLLFYGSPIHHVGIYVGGGQMVEAPETGEYVRYASIYRSDLVGAGRVN